MATKNGRGAGMKYVYRITKVMSSPHATIKKGAILVTDEDEGRYWCSSFFSHRTHSFEEQFRAMKIGTLEGRTKKERVAEMQKLLKSKGIAA